MRGDAPGMTARREPGGERRSFEARARGFDGDKVAVFRLCRAVCGDSELLAEHFLVDWFQAAAAMWPLPENPQHAMFGMIDNFDDAAAMADAVLVFSLLNAEEYAVAEAGSFARSPTLTAS